MKQRRHIFHSLTIEIVAVLLASMVSFQVYNKIGIRMSLLPFVMVAGYVVLKLLYHFCVWATGCIIELLSHKKVSLVNEPISIGTTTSSSNMEDIQKKRMELFHYEYQREQQHYQQRKEKEDDEKLCAILKYTRDTFKPFGFDEAEIFQICECVRYFVINRHVLTMTEGRIKKHSSVTQISLKNFAWNIAFQYNIGGDLTTNFVMATFAEWFSNCTFDTVRKNLRTTTGRHKIEIDEKILARYKIGNKYDNDTI